ncbi:Polyprenyl synthetase [Aspergillus parasiticus SU-1]|uniref:Isoprenoid synthase domain-containing protein n=2 Tax=Aspergillus parasiticus TaxID=5067 RepID=A0A5N6E043_ASPPA|nr:isoprenoid synthase domain-containing protein [Aspergillus parasiticus]KJK64315.1 Polyprenyl synthetase [Aspergillus parasiticus SU-1]
MFRQYSNFISHKRRRSKSTSRVLSVAQSEAASDAPTVNEPIEIWTHSQPIDAATQQQNDCFTTLTARIHKYDHVAQRGSDRFLEDLTATLDSEEAKSKSSYLTSPVGNYASFLYPECMPERLELVAYLTELGNVHDDHADSRNTPAADKPEELVESPRAEARKKLLEKVTGELTDKDGLEIIDCYRSNWLVTPDVPTADNCANLDDYVARRRLNAGIDVYWTLMGFAHGTRLGKEDQAIVRDALDAAERTMFFTNDYYSWPKEKREVKKRRVANVILFLMQHQNMSEDDARAKTKELILENEKEFVKRREALYQAHPDLAPKLRKWMEVLEAALGGIHYWCTNAPRYAVPETAEEESEEESDEDSSSDEDESEDDEEEEEEEENGEEEVRANGTIDHVEGGDEPEGEPVWTPLVNGEHPAVHLDATPLLAPTNYIGSISANEVQLELVSALNAWLQVPTRPLTFVKQVVNDLHDSSEILANIQDQSSLQRQKTAAHLVFGPAQSINSAAYMFVRVAKTVNGLNCPGMLDGLLEELETHFIGQSWELNWRFSLQCPTEQEYLEMVDKKSGSIFRMLVRLMQSASMEGSTLDFELLTQLFGRWYQIRNEYLGLLTGNNQRGFGEDLDHGKISYAVVRCCNVDPTAKSIILGIFRQKAEGVSLSAESKIQILELLHKSGALQATYDLVRQLGRDIMKTVSELEIAAEETNPGLKALVKTLGDIPAPTQE